MSTLYTLSPRSQHVARMVARGYTNPEIAAELNLTLRTVENYLGLVYAAYSFDANQSNQRVKLALAIKRDLEGC